MIIYRLSHNFYYRGIYLDDARFDNELDLLRVFKPHEPVEGLEGLAHRMETLKETREPELPRKKSDARFNRGVADLTTNSCCLIFNQRAVTVLEKYLRPAGQTIQFQVEDNPNEYFGFHCIRSIDAVDLDRSVLKRIKETGEVYGVDKYVFNCDAVEGVDVFRTRWPVDFDICVSHEFAEAVRAAGLTGFDFIERWRSEDDQRPAFGLDESLEAYIQRMETARGPTAKKRKARRATPAATTIETLNQRLLTPDDSVVVTADSVDSDDPGDIVRSSMEFVDALRGEGLRNEEISRDALKSYMLTEFVYQFDDGGFAQFAYNFETEPNALSLVSEALESIKAGATLAAFHRAATLLVDLSDEERQQFFGGEYFGENVERDKLGLADEALKAAMEEEDLQELQAKWLRRLPTLMPVPQDQLSREVERRASALPDRDRRLAELEESEPSELRCSRELCERAGLQFQEFIGMNPNAEHQGRRGLGLSFMTDAGPHWCLFVDDRVVLINSATGDEVLETWHAD